MYLLRNASDYADFFNEGEEVVLLSNLCHLDAIRVFFHIRTLTSARQLKGLEVPSF